MLALVAKADPEGSDTENSKKRAQQKVRERR